MYSYCQCFACVICNRFRFHETLLMSYYLLVASNIDVLKETSLYRRHSPEVSKSMYSSLAYSIHSINSYCSTICESHYFICLSLKMLLTCKYAITKIGISRHFLYGEKDERHLSTRAESINYY